MKRNWRTWAVALCAFFVAGWMAYDGIQALLVSGHLITPSSGEYAGQLGPWRHIVAAVGIDPAGRETQMVFAVYGIAWLAITAIYLMGQRWGRTAMLAAAMGALWYLPFGTIFGVGIIALLLTEKTS